MDGRGIMDQIRATTAKALREVAAEAAQDMRDLISHPGPLASEPGQPPHRQSGELASAIVSGVDEFTDADPKAYVQVVGAPHWRHLEYGTKRMQPRPFIRPTREKWAPIIRQRVQETMRRY